MASTQQALITSLYTAISATVPGTTVYDTMAIQDVEYPMVLFSVITDPVQQYFTKDSVRLDFQLDVYGLMTAGTKATRDLADLYFAGLHRATLTATGYTGVSILCIERGGGMQEEFVQSGRTTQDAWRVTQQYRLWATAN